MELRHRTQLRLRRKKIAAAGIDGAGTEKRGQSSDDSVLLLLLLLL